MGKCWKLSPKFCLGLHGGEGLCGDSPLSGLELGWFASGDAFYWVEWAWVLLAFVLLAAE